MFLSGCLPNFFYRNCFPRGGGGSSRLFMEIVFLCRFAEFFFTEIVFFGRFVEFFHWDVPLSKRFVDFLNFVRLIEFHWDCSSLKVCRICVLIEIVLMGGFVEFLHWDCSSLMICNFGICRMSSLRCFSLEVCRISVIRRDCSPRGVCRTSSLRLFLSEGLPF